MYFFLSNLSLPEIGFTSTTVPKMIVDIQSHSRVISSAGLPDSDVSLPFLEARKRDMLLSVMAYDRLLDSQLHHLIALLMTYFKDVEIPNFFCDPSQLPHLACCDAFTNNIIMYFPAAMFAFLPISGTIFSYSKIVSSILRVSSSGGKV
ncbi:olfactory receptor 7E24-like [Pongo pygmaeus]|uniref:olfactory receptor 7E24-like n=1 Tax=Pongo pygmaeus TaxID=9600 RepID=UPI00300CCC81